MPNNSHLTVILGPTASGKTVLAAQLAYLLDGEIISADSRQVYKHMNIGTGKDYEAYTVNGIAIPYHLIDICEPGEKYHIYQFQKDFYQSFQQIINKQKQPILCGGTGLYLESLLLHFQFTSVPVNEALRSLLESKTHEELLKEWKKLPVHLFPMADTATKKRTIRAIEIVQYATENPAYAPMQTTHIPSFSATVFGIHTNVETRRKAISERLEKRLQSGLVQEVEALVNKGVTYEMLTYYGLEYKWVAEFLQNKVDYTTMKARLETAIHQFAKRQMTYFRKMEKAGIHIHWLNGAEPINHTLEKMIQILQGSTY